MKGARVRVDAKEKERADIVEDGVTQFMADDVVRKTGPHRCAAKGR